jgi:NAD-dependent dihydropyrimidine dehydrogenase PreA subunit
LQPRARARLQITAGGRMPYVIAEPCIGVKDTACVDACPVDVIHPRPGEADFWSAAQLYIYPNDCICCGACVPVCPVSAIFLIEDLPEKWAHFAKINTDWYARRESVSNEAPGL